MDYVLKGHEQADNVISMLIMFCPNEKYIRLDEPSEELCLLSGIDGKKAEAVLYKSREPIARGEAVARGSEQKELKRAIGLSVFRAMQLYKPTDMPWGLLTGVRPAKLISVMRSEGLTDGEIEHSLRADYLISEDKIRLMFTVADSEERLVKGGIGKAAVYIGIPFCPTRCLYCSFTSYPLKQYLGRVDAYLDALEREIKFSRKYLEHRELESIYIGGGTPTSLNEVQLERLLGMVRDNFALPSEYTVEAGRPDTITREKLRILKQAGVGRISVNPQTLNDATLRLIGREHTSAEFVKAFEMAREEGHKHINTDIILGLPSEGEKEVVNTLEGLKSLAPESITVHTLAVKRASRLKETLEKYSMTGAEQMDRLIRLSAEYTRSMGMHPYYMYRQKNMVGNFENVGYCRQGCECVYNVAIMEEKQSVLALGAGASTKLVNNADNRIERIFNVKSVDDYINRIDEMLKRKEDGMKWL